MRVAILDNLRSAHNTGSVFRTASALAYEEIALCGVTIRPPSAKLRETSRGTEENLTWRSFKTTNEAIEYYRKSGYEIIALEVTEDAVPVHQLKAGKQCAFLVGNEAHGVGHESLRKADQITCLPMKNDRSGINVSCAFSAAAYIDHLKHMENEPD